ncbi:hypothetical protein HQ524_01775, partial [Candidatus Uhrbacteria bacterium]|nr:hypothetical protein [Candidatus Uhrbacteria bacterium]
MERADKRSEGFWFHVLHPGVMWLRFERKAFDGFSMPKWWDGTRLWAAFSMLAILVSGVMGYLLFVRVYTFGVPMLLTMPLWEVVWPQQRASFSMVVFGIVVGLGYSLACALIIASWQERHHMIYIVKGDGEDMAKFELLERDLEEEDSTKVLLKMPRHTLFGRLSWYKGWNFYPRDETKVVVSDLWGQKLNFETRTQTYQMQRVLFGIMQSPEPDSYYRPSFWKVLADLSQNAR